MLVWVALIMSEGRSLGERAAGWLERLFFDLLDSGVINGLVVESEVFFEGYAFIIDFRDGLGFSSGTVARGGVWYVSGLVVGHSL